MTDAQIRSLIILIGAAAFVLVLLILRRTLRAHRRNQQLALCSALQAEQQEKLQEYEESIRVLLAQIEAETCDMETALFASEQCQKYLGGFLTGQPMVDALLAYKRKECDDRQIALQVETTGFPSHGFSDAEYVGMLGNLLDNAIEASVKTEHPWVALRSFMAGGQWVLRVSNAKPREETPLVRGMETTKEDKNNHGLGTRIIKKIVNQHQGVVDYKDYGDYFEVTTAISMMQENP